MSRFAFVAAERANHAVATLCRVVGASVSGFYAWLRAVPSVQARAEAEAELQRLKRENKRLEEEVEILRKAAAFMGWPAPHSGESAGSPADR